MNKVRLLSFGLSACLVAGGSAPALAHHSFALFDRDKTITLSGTVRTFAWTNPHARVWLFVPKDATGATDLWAVEFSSGPAMLVREGWHKDTLHPGDKLTVDIHPLRDGRMGGILMNAHLPDGRVLQENIDPSKEALDSLTKPETP